MGVFHFDNSSNHQTYAPDALLTRNLIKKDGGAKANTAKKPMRSTKYTDVNGNEILQPMQTEEGVQKGLITILTERGRDVAGKSKDELEAMLKQEPDFQNQLTLAWKSNFSLSFIVNLIGFERYWCHIKRNVRKNCDYSFNTLVAAVPKYLDEVDVLTMRRCAQVFQISMHTGQEMVKVI